MQPNHKAEIPSAEVAPILGLTRAGLIRLVQRGGINARKLPGRTGAYLFDPDEVAALAAERAK